MGKYKKYAKPEQSLDHPNKVSENNSNNNAFNQSNKTKNRKLEFNNKNELYKLNNGNYIKADENSLREILWEIWDAMKYFLFMCKDFLIPSGLSFKIFGSFIILEVLYQGIIIYIINYVLTVLNKYFSIWQKTTNMYIYLISYVQLFYIFICEGLLIFRFIHFKIFIFEKLNWLINILTCFVIISNTFSINELNYRIYRFHGKNNDINLLSNKDIRDNLVSEYINLYVNKDDDFEQYELCYEMKLNDVVFEKIKNKIPHYHWHFDTNSNLYIICKNNSILNKPIYGQEYKPNAFFNCQNRHDANNAPNYCVSAKYRQKRFYAHLKIALYEIIFLILWNLYNYFSIKFIYHFFPSLKNCRKSNLCRQNLTNNDKNLYKNNINKTVTYKDINDVKKNREIYESDTEGDENEPEEEERNERKNEEKKNNSIKEVKMRKISKKKWKTYKKKRKNRYNREEKVKNKNKYFDEGILSKDYYEKNKDNNDDFSDKNDDENEDYFKINKNEVVNRKKNELAEKEEDDENDDGEEEEEEDDKEEEEEDGDIDDYVAKRNKLDEIRKIYLKKVRKYQYLETVYNFLVGNYINWIKDKIHQILLEIDRNLTDEDE